MKAPRYAGRLVEASGVVAAIVLGILVNVLVARHYRRWDLTSCWRPTRRFAIG